MLTLKLGMPHQVAEYYQGCSSDDPGLTLTFFREGQIWSLMFFVFRHVSRNTGFFFRPYYIEQGPAVQDRIK